MEFSSFRKAIGTWTTSNVTMSEACRRLNPLSRRYKASNVKGPLLWTLVPGGTYFVPTDAPRSVRYFDFATKNVRAVFDIGKDFSYGLLVSPDGRWILYSQVDDLKSEILLVDHFR